MSTNDPALTPSLFGKLPAHGDFVRAGAHGPAQLAFATWLAAAVERSHGELPAESVRFLFSTPEEQLFVGAWVASHDEVGRAFPLASLREVPSELAAFSWSGLPLFYANFLGGVERCLRTGVDEGLAWLKQVLPRLVEPHASELPGLLHDAREQLASQRLDVFCARAFANPSTESLCYALDTLERAARLEGESLTLDVPVHSALDLFVWLELLRGSCATGARAVLWTEQRGRALICIGSPSEQLLVFLLNPQHKGAQRWPLWTDSQEAVAVARTALRPSVRSLIEGNASVLELVFAHQQREA